MMWFHFLRRMLTVTLFAAVAVGCGRNFDGLVAKAQDKFEQKRHIEAIDALNHALAVWRDADGKEHKGKALELLGRAHQAAYQPEKAAVAYEEALKNSGNVYDAAYGLGIIRLAASRFDQAAQAFDLALRMKKDDPPALIGLGNAHFGARNYDAAIAAYNRLLDTSPGVRDALSFIRIAEARRAAARRAPARRR